MIKCKLCNSPAEEIDFCYGCNAYICEKCGTYPDVPTGKHEPLAHRKLSEALLKLAEAQKEIEAIVGNDQ